jgi:hypothetical protein
MSEAPDEPERTGTTGKRRPKVWRRATQVPPVAATTAAGCALGSNR